MSGRIYLLKENCALQSLTEQPYASEDLLQTLLADYPDLLAGEQMDEAEPRRWLLVSREIGVPAEEDSAGRWSLDHLFLDQDGIPTLVEVKRSGDTRIRREVVVQMLDYAAKDSSPNNIYRTAAGYPAGGMITDLGPSLRRLPCR